MTPVFVIARLVLKEASRRRLLIIVAVLTVLLIALTAWGVQRITSSETCQGGQPCSPLEMRALVAVLMILVSFMFSSIFTMGAVFVTAPAINTEVESGVILAMLPRPIRRSDVILGKWLGLSVLVGGYTAVTMAVEFAVINAVVGYVPPQPMQTIAFLAGESVVMLTLALLVSTRLAPMAGGMVALVLFGLAWMGGIAKAVGTALGSDTVRNIGTASSLILPTDGLWRGALYHLQPSLMAEAAGFNRMMSANPFFAAAPPSVAYIAWAAAWTLLVLALAILSFERREL